MVDNPPFLMVISSRGQSYEISPTTGRFPPPKKKMGEILPEAKSYLEPQTTIYKWIFGDFQPFSI